MWALGFLELSLGRAEAAHAYLGPLTRALLEAGIREPGELRSLPDEIEALAALGRLDEAETLLAPFEETADGLARPSALGAARRCRGLLEAARGDLPAALDALGDAVAAHERSPLPLELARSRLALGSVQRRANHRRLSRGPLTAASEGFERLGAAVWAERARAELARLGGRRSVGGELTPGEARVAALVAEGRSNKDVAAALFVSVKTVEGHLSHVYEKLGVHSRGELAHRLLAGKDQGYPG
jgi:DNA-binding CsgD family transcriptional regulator